MKKRTSPEIRQFLVYQAEDGQIKIDVRLEEETVWLTQQQMADLFQTSEQNISLYKPLVDQWRFYDNADFESAKLIAAGCFNQENNLADPQLWKHLTEIYCHD